MLCGIDEEVRETELLICISETLVCSRVQEFSGDKCKTVRLALRFADHVPMRNVGTVGETTRV